MLEKFERILSALKIGRYKRKLLKKLLKSGGSLASYRLVISFKNYCPEVKTIIDVGANQGQFALAAGEIFPDANIYSFEPVPEVFDILKKNTESAGNIRVFNTALGSEAGQIKFYKNDFSHASSAFPIHNNQVEMLPETSHTTEITVGVDRLENFLRKIELKAPVLLKLDVQGFEKEVLLGAGDMTGIDYLLFETSFMPMYQGEPLFDEMHSFVKEKGYEPVAPLGFMELQNFKIPQMDLLYRRKDK